MRISIIGPPSSGKGTVSEKLARKYKLFHLSPGELLREEIAKGTVIGKQIKKYTDKGDLVPDQFVVELVKMSLKGHPQYILDGYPRSVGQAKAGRDVSIDEVISLNVSKEEVLERYSGRRLCEKEGHSYHLKYLPPQKAGICDVDGSRLIRRRDDNPKVIHKRYREYQKTSKPVINYFKRKGILKVVDGNGKPKEVYENVLKALR